MVERQIVGAASIGNPRQKESDMSDDFQAHKLKKANDEPEADDD